MLNSPVLITNKIKDWEILSFTDDEWCNEFQGRNLSFRKGYKTYHEGPFWERLSEEENITMRQFFDISKSEDANNFWLYYDYKYMKDILPENSNVVKSVKWANFGVAQLTGRDSSLWIGNKGAHTPCHMDSYGFNLVAQIKGRKLWILISPDEMDSLCPTRVPYEESSVYSSYNFYTPNLDLLNIKNAYKVILNPGDVLYVPKNWWHYVENLELSVSINLWVPQVSDDESRLDEALVRHYVSSICQMMTENEAKSLLNPNEYDLIHSPFEEKSLEFFINKCKEKDNDSDKFHELKSFLEKHSVEIPKFPVGEIKNYIYSKAQELGYVICDVSRSKGSQNGKDTIYERLINSYCHPKVVALVREKILGGG